MKTFHRYSIVLGVLLLAVLVWKIGPWDLFRQMASIGWGMAILLLLEGLEHVFHTQGWRHCLSGPSRDFAESSNTLLFAFGLALVLIYLMYHVLPGSGSRYISPPTAGT